MGGFWWVWCYDKKSFPVVCETTAADKYPVRDGKPFQLFSFCGRSEHKSAKTGSHGRRFFNPLKGTFLKK